MMSNLSNSFVNNTVFWAILLLKNIIINNLAN